MRGCTSLAFIELIADQHRASSQGGRARQSIRANENAQIDETTKPIQFRFAQYHASCRSTESKTQEHDGAKKRATAARDRSARCDACRICRAESKRSASTHGIQKTLPHVTRQPCHSMSGFTHHRANTAPCAPSARSLKMSSKTVSSVLVVSKPVKAHLAQV